MIDIFDIVSPGDRVDLQLISDNINDNPEDAPFYITKVYDVDDDGDVDIVMPMEKLKVVLLSIDDEYELFFYAKKGIYTCKATVIERYKEDNTFIATLEPYTELKKQQRREYYRYDCVIGMNTRELSESEAERFYEYKEPELFSDPQDKAVIVDISGGGIRFVSSEHYTNGNMILCKYMLNSGDTTKVYTSVIRLLSSFPVANNPKNTEYRGQFMFMDERVREDIIKYIFEEERKMRHRR